MNKTDELDRRAQIELEKLGVAEELGWIVAILAAVVVHLTWGHWWLTVGALFVGYFLVTMPYRRSEKRASDAYERASGTGKYARFDDTNDGEE